MDYYAELPSKHINYALDGKAMLGTGIVLFMALLIILCFHNYGRILFRNRRRVQPLLSISTATPPITVASKGLDPSVIKTIPTFVYSTKASHFPPIECAVCLSDFENDEKARVLPRCNHTFHVDCIDMWFYSNSNCPLCRAPVEADIQVNPPKILEQTVFGVVESAGSLKLESRPMKTLELVEVGILVETPTGEDRLTSIADVGSSNQIVIMKRIWSV